jgi:hypothetical protein
MKKTRVIDLYLVLGMQYKVADHLLQFCFPASLLLILNEKLLLLLL